MTEKKLSETYQSPLGTRYSSQEMSFLFSPQFKYSTWRRLWVALAESEKELGLPISKEQIDELKQAVHSIPFKTALDYEEKVHHDVMAHILALGDQCPLAKPIIHLGATSCYVTDNGDIIQIDEAFSLLLKKLDTVIDCLAKFAHQYKDLPCLGYTHFQPAQLTTVGKRATLWIQDLVLDRNEFQYRKENLQFLGAKGATGTQASYLALFNGDRNKVKELDILVANKMGFEHFFPISGQTYTRKQDVFILNALAGFAASCHKCTTDIRLLAGLREMRESFAKEQVGSSAMPYKKNPILSERVCSLSRYLISLAQNPLYTHATQWLERSLDDSANRRLTLSEAFLTADALLDLMKKIIEGLNVNKEEIEEHIKNELVHLATENILMAAVKKGGDRQILHEKIRGYCLEASKKEKEKRENFLLTLLEEDQDILLSRKEIEDLIDISQYIGRAPEQVEEFLFSIRY